MRRVFVGMLLFASDTENHLQPYEAAKRYPNCWSEAELKIANENGGAALETVLGFSGVDEFGQGFIMRFKNVDQR